MSDQNSGPTSALAQPGGIVPVLAGPTGVGKTDLSIELAHLLKAEIVSVDSRQIYRQLTIGAAKPSREQLSAVRHHFIDELSLEEPCSSGRFAIAARRRIREISARGKIPLVVGGSTLYLKALQYGLSDVPEVDPEVRASVIGRLREHGPEQLYRELIAVDPASAARLDPTKSQRLVRALEVYHATGRALSSFHTSPSGGTSLPSRTVVLFRDRAELYERINRRVDSMIERGLIEEVRQILLAGFNPQLNALRTIGYRETIAHLQGKLGFNSFSELVKRNTRRYAKRQMTWLKRFSEYHWVAADAPPETILASLMAFGDVASEYGPRVRSTK